MTTSHRRRRALLVHFLTGVALALHAAASGAAAVWQPFAPVARPAVPILADSQADSPTGGFQARNPIDAFIAAEQHKRGLKPRPEAPKEILLRRVYLDLIGLPPTTQEQAAFEEDRSTDAYERVVDRLLSDPRHGERWARHWMDVWRYSDWAGWSGGNQIRDSKPHIWKWRDWIVESLNADKGYDRMIVEMLAADEATPEDAQSLRATGFLVRNYKMLSREQWLEDTLKHTSQAFLGVTLGCAKCHDHVYDPISQADYYQMRAIFEPHWVRTDPVPGDTNVLKAGLVRVFDTDTNPPTYFLNRGDERKPDTNRLMVPNVPRALGGALEIQPVSLPASASRPDRRDFFHRDTLAAADAVLAEARGKLSAARKSQASDGELKELELSLALTEARRGALATLFEVEALEDAGKRGSEAWAAAAQNTVLRQRATAVAEARLTLHKSRLAEAEEQRKVDAERAKLVSGTNAPQTAVTTNNDDGAAKRRTEDEKLSKSLAAASSHRAAAVKALAEAEAQSKTAPGTNYLPRTAEQYPANSTGRRLAFARWIANTNNPLTARVAANQIWLKHFGQAIVPSPNDFGRNGKPPSHPELLDWLASELMRPTSGAQPGEPWSMKRLHRLIVTSRAYRMASTPDENNARIDPDNTYLWRMNSRRMEAEAVRDSLLYVSGGLDLERGGPEIDNNLGLTSKRRSLYMRQAAEKEVEFLKIFDGPTVTECYARRPTVVPQQALAMANSELTLNAARSLVKALSNGGTAAAAEDFPRDAFQRVLGRKPSPEELRLCREFIEVRKGSASGSQAQEALAIVLFNHNDFVTVR
ncbi:MAG: DUF1553 domain-containing protein [Verrucomicrobia bacterium]|nr:DUF1553 domain-containing protein [Verrucomicrobiota bacterium]